MDRRKFLQTAAGSSASLAIPKLFTLGDGQSGGGNPNSGPSGFAGKAIESVARPGVFLRLDANGLSSNAGSVGGAVSCRRGISMFEVFSIQTNPDNSISIASLAFPNVYLRLDATRLSMNRPQGGGVVNGQYNDGPLTKFRLMNQPNGQLRIMSAATPYVYLRMDASEVAPGEGSIGGIVNAQRNPLPDDLLESFVIRDVPGSIFTSQAADYPYAFTEMYMTVFGGVTSNRVALSSNLTMQQPDDGENAQGWLVRPVPGLLDEFHIYPAGAGGAGRCLTASDQNNSVLIAPVQPANLRQHWQFEPLDSGEEYCYRIRITGGTQAGAVYLSARQDGQGLNLVPADTHSGREQWRYIPRTEITPQTLPQWDCKYSLNLGDYLKANSSRSTIRLFAYEVFVSSTAEWRTDLDRMAADIRVDCAFLRFLGPNPSINISGAGSVTDPPTAPNPLDIASFCPNRTQAPARGPRGFDAGRLEINAQNINNQFATGSIGLYAAGGNGGCGQRGYIGRIPDGLGLDGEPGGNGGMGGDGGSGGTILIRANTVYPNANPTIVEVSSGGRPGPGGVGGAGGKGAPPRSVGGASGRQGKTGDPGLPGTSSGPAGSVQFTRTLDRMHTFWSHDTQPDSLRTRLFDSLRFAVNTLTLTGNLQQTNTHLNWLSGLADTLGYADVLASISRIQASIEENGSSTAWLKTINQQQTLTMRADTLKTEFTNLLQLPVGNNPGIISQVIHKAARRPLALTAPRPKGPQPMGAQPAPANDPDWTATIQALLTQIPTGNGQVSLADLLGDDACDLPEACAALRRIAPGDLSQQPATGNHPTHPMFVFFPFLAIGVAFVALNAGMYTAYRLHQRAQERERQRREEEERRRQEEARRYNEDLTKWVQDQLNRNLLDPINLDNIDKETERERMRRLRQRKRTDETPVIVAYGSQYIGILDSLEPVEDQSGTYVAVFDAFLDVFVSNPMLAAIASLVISKLQTFMIEVRVDGITARSLALGDWHVLAVTTSSSPSDGSMFACFTIPYPRLNETIPRFALAMVATPDISVRLQYVFRLPLYLSVALDIAFQNIPVKVPPSKKPRIPKTSHVASARVRAEVLQNVGQATFHTFNDQAQTPIFAFDLGDGPPLNVTAEATAKMLGLQRHGMAATIALSHWDKDHYKGMLKNNVQTTCPVLAPAFGIRGPMVTGLVRAIASNGAGHLFLAGSYTTNFVLQDPIVAANAEIAITLDPLLALPNLNIPSNISLELSEHSYVDANYTFDKNNVETITAYITGANNEHILLPGDCSYSYVSSAQKVSLTHIEATHHGSIHSLLVIHGQGPLSPGNSDIPSASIPAGTVYYSYGENNMHHISAANVRAHYARSGFTIEVVTYTDARNGEIDIPL